MARSIPEGYELLSGRGSENARKAISLAEERGVDASRVISQTDGYLIPLGEDSHIHSAEAPAGPVGDPIANIADRQGTQPDADESGDDPVPTATDSHAEIDAWAADHNITFDGIEAENADKPTRAEKIAHIEKNRGA